MRRSGSWCVAAMWPLLVALALATSGCCRLLEVAQRGRSAGRGQDVQVHWDRGKLSKESLEEGGDRVDGRELVEEVEFRGEGDDVQVHWEEVGRRAGFLEEVDELGERGEGVQVQRNRGNVPEVGGREDGGLNMKSRSLYASSDLTKTPRTLQEQRLLDVRGLQQETGNSFRFKTKPRDKTAGRSLNSFGSRNNAITLDHKAAILQEVRSSQEEAQGHNSRKVSK